jgi:hypothetical protein
LTDDTPDDLVAQTGRYATEMGRYREFRAVFSTDQGKRVLAEILRLGFSGRSSAVTAGFDTNRTFFNEGKRDLSHEIFKVAHVEPHPKPTKLVSKPPLRRD